MVDITGTLVYRMDAGVDSSVQLLYGLHPGSGDSDMRLLVLSSLFTGGPYVYLYSKFTDADAGGFEEWALNPVTSTPTQVPEPSVLALMLLAGLRCAAGGLELNDSRLRVSELFRFEQWAFVAIGVRRKYLSRILRRSLLSPHAGLGFERRKHNA